MSMSNPAVAKGGRQTIFLSVTRLIRQGPLKHFILITRRGEHLIFITHQGSLKRFIFITRQGPRKHFIFTNRRGPIKHFIFITVRVLSDI